MFAEHDTEVAEALERNPQCARSLAARTSAALAPSVKPLRGAGPSVCKAARHPPTAQFLRVVLLQLGQAVWIVKDAKRLLAWINMHNGSTAKRYFAHSYTAFEHYCSATRAHVDLVAAGEVFHTYLHLKGAAMQQLDEIDGLACLPEARTRS
jgi:hypothetical protein